MVQEAGEKNCLRVVFHSLPRLSNYHEGGVKVSAKWRDIVLIILHNLFNLSICNHSLRITARCPFSTPIPRSSLRSHLQQPPPCFCLWINTYKHHKSKLPSMLSTLIPRHLFLEPPFHVAFYFFYYSSNVVSSVDFLFPCPWRC